MLDLVAGVVNSVLTDYATNTFKDLTDDLKMRKTLLSCVEKYISLSPDCGCSLDELKKAISDVNIQLIRPQTAAQLEENLTSILGKYFKDDKTRIYIKDIADAYSQVLYKYVDIGDIFQQNEKIAANTNKLILQTVEAIRAFEPVYDPKEQVERLKAMNQPHFCFLDEIDQSKIWFNITLYLYGDDIEECISEIADDIEADYEILDSEDKFMCIHFYFSDRNRHQYEFKEYLRHMDKLFSQNNIMLLNFLID